MTKEVNMLPSSPPEVGLAVQGMLPLLMDFLRAEGRCAETSSVISQVEQGPKRRINRQSAQAVVGIGCQSGSAGCR